MAYSQIENRFLDSMAEAQFPTAPEPAAQEPVQNEGVQVAMGGNAAGRRSDAPLSDVPRAMLDMGAATLKGMTQGFAGLPGDLEGLARSAINLMGGKVDENTVMPTTDEVKAWLDKFPMTRVGDGNIPYESIGEVTAPGGQLKAGKAVLKGAKEMAPKAAEMIVNATEKTGVPVRGLSIVERTTPDSPWIAREEFNAYMNQPKQLHGFKKDGPNKGFNEQKYKHAEFVEVQFEDGTSHIDAIRGLNKSHALSRAFGNWPNATAIKPLARSEVEKVDPDLVKEVDAAMPAAIKEKK